MNPLVPDLLCSGWVCPVYCVDPPDGEGVGLRVENPLVQRYQVVVTEQQVEILQRLGQEERLLHIVLLPSDLQQQTVISVYEQTQTGCYAP